MQGQYIFFLSSFSPYIVVCLYHKFKHTLESQFNKVPRDWSNWFVISRVCYVEKVVITNLLENNQKYSLYQGIVSN